MSALFPGAPDVTTYWQNILGGVDAVSDPPPGSWNPDVHFDPDSKANDRVYCKRGGYLSPIAAFDPAAHGIMPLAVDGGEPDQWLALKVAKAALQDAGYVGPVPVRQRTAVVIGKGTYINRGNLSLVQHGLVVDQTLGIIRTLHPEFGARELQAIREELKRQLPPFTTETVPGLVPNIIAGRIANRLDLMGPSYTVDAACASSLIALQIAMRDLLSGECDMALVGGSQITTPVPIFALFCQLSALSRRQQIRPFDQDADGTILGEGIGMVVLKRRDDAERDGDRIYALLKGVGTASDGKAVSVMAPRLEGEVLALRRAYEAAGVDPSTVGLIEAHGTGTPVGDATEIESLKTVFGTRAGGTPHCALGSVKSMIGHTMPAAGIAGVIKASLALYHRVLPPMINVTAPNPRLKIEDSTFYVNVEARPWIHGSSDAPRRAGVNAFGFGGINAHAVLEEYPHADESALETHQPIWDSEVLLVSASSAEALIAEIDLVLAALGSESSTPDVCLKDLAFTLNSRPRRGARRLGIVATDVNDLRAKLRRARQRLDSPNCRRIKDASGIYYFAEPLAAQGKIAVLFPGEGAQYPGMLADLCVHFPAVRAAVDAIERVFWDHQRGYRTSDLLFPPSLLPKAEREALQQRLWQIDGAVEAVLTANQALWQLMTQLGLRPDAVVGHSTGEYSAMRAAGVLNLDDPGTFARFANDLNDGHRATAADTGVPAAGMLAVGAERDQVEAVAGRVKGRLYVAMDNCPHQSVVVGDRAAVEEARALVQQEGWLHEFLSFDRAYHTQLFSPYTEHLRGVFAHLPISSPATPIYSCTTAAPYPRDPAEIRHLMVEHWVKPVEFRKTVEALYADGVRLFVEVGPRGNLTAFVEDILRGREFCAVGANLQRRSGTMQLNHLVATLSAQGVDLNLEPLYRRRRPRVLDLAALPSLPSRAEPSLATGFPLLTLSSEAAKRFTGATSEKGAIPPALEAPAVAAVPSGWPAAAAAGHPGPPPARAK
jgi:polyketide-type polyunsaturated fatty acid synthase PfaA